ncbi:MAG TPA: hypothetical protein VEJ18_00715 [Planctomycetota bacterium]|nr:hypothetical protein [Planctomycetota bacterium]
MAAVRSRKVLDPFVALARQACDSAVRRPEDTRAARAMLADAMEDAPGAPSWALDWQADIRRGLDCLRMGRRPDGRAMLQRMARAGLVRWDDIPEHRAALALHAALASLPSPLPEAPPDDGERWKRAARLRSWLRAVLGAACPGVRQEDWGRIAVLLPKRQDTRSDYRPDGSMAVPRDLADPCPATAANDAAFSALRALIEAGFPRLYWRAAEAEPF